MRQPRKETEETALKVGVPLLIAGLATGAAAGAVDNRWSNPFFYVAVGVFAVGLYLVLGAYMRFLPLPLVPSDRWAKKVREGTDALIDRAHELRSRQTRTEEAQSQWIADYSAWLDDAKLLLTRLDFAPDVESFSHHEGETIGDHPRFNEEDSELRRRPKWQTQIIRGVRNRVP